MVVAPQLWTLVPRASCTQTARKYITPEPSNSGQDERVARGESKNPAPVFAPPSSTPCPSAVLFPSSAKRLRIRHR